MVAGFAMRKCLIEARFKDSQSCQDIDQSSSDTLIYEVRRPTGVEPSQLKLVEILLMKLTRYGKIYSGDTISKILPRYEYFNQKITMLEIKRYIYQKISSVFKEGAKRFAND